MLVLGSIWIAADGLLLAWLHRAARDRRPARLTRRF
jgi:hypothetical protein